MKKFLSLLVTVAFISGTVGFASASGTTTTTPPAAEKKTTDKPATKDTKAAEKTATKSKSATGTVKSAAADSVVVAGKDKGKDAEWTFAVDSSTKIKKAGKDLPAADLKAGDGVTVKYTEKEGKMLARDVMVKGGMSAAKKAANPCAAKPAEKK